MSSGIPRRAKHGVAFRDTRNAVILSPSFALRASEAAPGSRSCWCGAGRWRGSSAQFSSGVNLVEVYAAVTDEAGNPVTGPDPRGFHRPRGRPAADPVGLRRRGLPAVGRAGRRSQLQHGREAAADRDQRGADLPRRAAAAGPVDARRDRIRDRGRSRRCRPIGAAQLRALSALKPWGTTGLHDAIIQSIDAIQAAKGRRALVLLSDGSDRYSKATAAEALDRARRSDVMIYPIAIGGTRPRALRAARVAHRRPLVPAEDARRAERHHAHDRERAAPPVSARLHAVTADRPRRGTVAPDHRPRESIRRHRARA